MSSQMKIRNGTFLSAALQTNPRDSIEEAPRLRAFLGFPRPRRDNPPDP